MKFGGKRIKKIEKFKREMDEERKFQIKNYKYVGYEQILQWDVSALNDISEVLLKPTTKVKVYDDEYEYIEPITTTNTLKNITKAIQDFYNKVIDNDRRSCFYIESVECTEQSEYIELNFSHGT